MRHGKSSHSGPSIVYCFLGLTVGAATQNWAAALCAGFALLCFLVIIVRGVKRNMGHGR